MNKNIEYLLTTYDRKVLFEKYKSGVIYNILFDQFFEYYGTNIFHLTTKRNYIDKEFKQYYTKIMSIQLYINNPSLLFLLTLCDIFKIVVNSLIITGFDMDCLNIYPHVRRLNIINNDDGFIKKIILNHSVRYTAIHLNGDILNSNAIIESTKPLKNVIDVELIIKDKKKFILTPTVVIRKSGRFKRFIDYLYCIPCC